MRKIEAWETEDGEIFRDKEAARGHEFISAQRSGLNDLRKRILKSECLSEFVMEIYRNEGLINDIIDMVSDIEEK